MSVIEEVESLFVDATEVATKVCEESIVNGLVTKLKESVRSIDISSIDWIDEIPSGKGIYFFEMKFSSSETNLDNAMKSFGNSWQLWKTTKDGITPSFQLQRSKMVVADVTVDDWIPFYIGKRDNIKSRIIDHVSGPTNTRTSALRLSDRANELSSQSFRLSYLTFNLSQNEYKLMPFLEEALRSKLLPIIGRQ